MGIMDIYEVELCRRGRWEQQDGRFVAAGDADEAAYKVTGEHLHSEGEYRKVRLRVRRLGNGSPPPKLFSRGWWMRRICSTKYKSNRPARTTITSAKRPMRAHRIMPRAVVTT